MQQEMDRLDTFEFTTVDGFTPDIPVVQAFL